MNRVLRAPAAAILAALAVLAAAGCADTGSDTEVVSAADLQKDIAARLAQAGAPPKSVTCRGGLPGQPGAATRCDVALSDTNSIEPVVTLVTADPVNYTVTPAVSAEQLAAAVANVMSAQQVSCQSGLDGTTGAQAAQPGQAAQTLCEVTRNGTRITHTVEVTDVEGLLMSYSVLPSLGEQELEGILADRLEAQTGQRPARVDCSADLQGRVGATADCAVETGGKQESRESRDSYVLTVTTVDGDAIDFSLEPRR